MQTDFNFCLQVCMSALVDKARREKAPTRLHFTVCTVYTYELRGAVMAVDTSMIDSLAFYRQYVTLSGRNGKRAKNWITGETEYHGSCPWCGGDDRFMFIDTGRYSCKIRSGGCGRYGSSPYWFLRDYEGLNHWEACERLNIDPGSEYIEPVQRYYEGKDVAPCKQWQERASAVIHQAQMILWSKRGIEALAYLRNRGLTDETIRDAKLGYIPLNSDGRWYKDTLEQWGLLSADSADADNDPVWLPEGILIPWYADGSVWKLQVRRLSELREGDSKYLDITGSGECLYNADSINADMPVVVSESAIDGLSGKQSCEDMAVFVATGSTTRAKVNRWIARIASATRVIIAFDDDEPDEVGKRAGEAGAEFWLEMFPDAIHWLPWEHDLNDMLRAGVNLRDWLAIGISSCEVIEASPTEEEIPVSFKARPCSRCGSHEGRKRDDGVWLCVCYFARLAVVSLPPTIKQRPTWASLREMNRGLSNTCSQCDAPAKWYGPGCTPYCDDCWPGSRYELVEVAK